VRALEFLFIESLEMLAIDGYFVSSNLIEPLAL
jgi:hypothetical protein